jgi:hypothetical protein
MLCQSSDGVVEGHQADGALVWRERINVLGGFGHCGADAGG